MRRRMLTLCMALALCLTLLPAPAAAVTGTYCAYTWDGSTLNCSEPTIPENAIEIPDGYSGDSWGTGSDSWYVVTGSDVTISGRVTVNGSVHLILTDGCSLTVTGGIQVAAGNSLTIYGQRGDTGSLTAQVASGSTDASPRAET